MRHMIPVLLLSLALTGTAFAAGTVDGKAIFLAKCAGCHGADGAKTSAGNKPLKGLGEATIAQALRGYKAKTFGGPKKAVMQGLAAKLSDAEIKAVSAYTGKL